MLRIISYLASPKMTTEEENPFLIGGYFVSQGAYYLILDLPQRAKILAVQVYPFQLNPMPFQLWVLEDTEKPKESRNFVVVLKEGRIKEEVKSLHHIGTYPIYATEGEFSHLFEII